MIITPSTVCFLSSFLEKENSVEKNCVCIGYIIKNLRMFILLSKQGLHKVSKQIKEEYVDQVL